MAADLIRAAELLESTQAKAAAAEETLPEALRRAEALSETLGVDFTAPSRSHADVDEAATVGDAAR
jgi:hypothetical protein